MGARAGRGFHHPGQETERQVQVRKSGSTRRSMLRLFGLLLPRHFLCPLL